MGETVDQLMLSGVLFCPQHLDFKSLLSQRRKEPENIHILEPEIKDSWLKQLIIQTVTLN